MSDYDSFNPPPSPIGVSPADPDIPMESLDSDPQACPEDCNHTPMHDDRAAVPFGWAPGTFQAVFAAIFQEAFDLLVERQKKYGPNNIERLGLFGVFSRLSSDKIERIRRGMNGKVVNGEVVIDDFSDFGDESFEDALLDIANYALIMIAQKRGLWGRPLA